MTITDNPIDIEALRRFIAPPEDAPTPVIPDVIAAQARELDGIREVMRTLKDRQDVLRASMINFLDEQGVDSVAERGVSIARSTHTRLNIDRKFLETQYPKVYADCAAPAQVTQVRVDISG